MMKDTDFLEFAKMPRLSREAIITEKIDGTNASIVITAGVLEESREMVESRSGQLVPVYKDPEIVTVVNDFTIRVGSRNKYIKPGKQTDNYGFAQWVLDNREELIKLGEGRHFGEWWGSGINRNYNMKEKVFSLFNIDRWSDDQVRPKCCRVVPELWRGIFDTNAVDEVLGILKEKGSQASPGFMNPEGVVVWHVQGNRGYKKTLDKNDEHKGV